MIIHLFFDNPYIAGIIGSMIAGLLTIGIVNLFSGIKPFLEVRADSNDFVSLRFGACQAKLFARTEHPSLRFST